MSDRIVSLGIGLTAVLATAVGVNIAKTPRAPAGEDPPVVRAKPRASLPVVLPVPQPQLLVVHAPPPPAPSPPPVPEPPPPPEPRAATPRLDVECDLASFTDGGPASCAWNRGFPAISADGATIVQAVNPDDGGRGYPGLVVQFLDVATARVISTHTIIDPNDFDDLSTLPSRKRAAVDRRAARVQEQIDAGRYRSLARVQMPNDEWRYASPLRADVEGDRIRIVDLATNAALWEHRYDVAVQYPNRKLDPDVAFCEPTATHSIEAWWDATTRTLITSVGYGAGSCMCSDEIVNYVIKL